MKLRQQIINKVFKPIEQVYYDTIQAEIINYNEKTNSATIQFQDPRGEGIIELEKVPVQLGSGGIHSSGPFPGDTVWVSFNNRNLLYPKIIALGDNDYVNNTREKYKHTKQGAYMPNDIEEHTVDTILPITTGWINEENTEYSYYASVDPEEELYNLLENIGYYNNSEPGITHPLNGTTIKVDDDGIITLFTGLGDGIKINPLNNTIQIISSKAVHQNDETIFNSNKWTINCDDSVNVKAKGDINMNAEGYINLSAKKINHHEEE